MILKSLAGIMPAGLFSFSDLFKNTYLGKHVICKLYPEY
jgi:hypothetical protein